MSFCQAISHGRSSLYESNTVKKTYYQCQNLECSCTFTALEAVHTIITRPQKEGESLDSPDQQYQQEPADRLPRHWTAMVRHLNFPAVSRFRSEHYSLHRYPGPVPGFLCIFPRWPENAWVHVYAAWNRMSLMHHFWRESPCVAAPETIYEVHENQSVKWSGQAGGAARVKGSNGNHLRWLSGTIPYR